MIGKLFLLAVLPGIVFGRVTVNIKAGNTKDEAKVDVLGSDIEIISDKEIGTFNLGDHNLKASVEKFWYDLGYPGGWPTDVYVKSPTPWNDLYKRYKWDQVQRVLRPVSVKVIGLRTEPTIVAKQEFINNSSLPGKFNAAIEQSVEQTSSNSWSKSGEFSFNQEINYKVDLKVAEVGGSTSFGYTSGWGEETSKSITSKVGSTSGVEVELQPGQAVVSQLTANKGTMEVQVDYAITVNGDVAVNYEKTFRGHHFWRVDVNEALTAHGDKTVFESREILKIGYYSDARIVVTDASKTDTIIFSGPVPIIPESPLLSAPTYYGGYDD